jgi:glutamate racemase
VAVSQLRKKYHIPIFGMEPALKPAVLENPDQKIAVLATPLTLREEKFMRLGTSLEAHAVLKSVPCDGLATIIDTGDIDKAREYLQPILKNLEEEKIDILVLGCTHYVLVKSIFYDWNPNVKLYDGNQGTANQVKRILIPLPIEGDSKLDLFLNGGKEEDFENAYNYLNMENTTERNYVK